MKREYQLYAVSSDGKKVRLLATFYHLQTAKEMIQTSITSYDLTLYYNKKKIYSIISD